MKILELKLRNLNSLYGEWKIDFTDSEFTSNGIFALTGATGAGKSTILDAICLALYGQTPRLGRVTQGANEIMSRQTGECYAEVLFESQAGRFRCQWGQRRAYAKASGALQQQHHQISEDLAGTIIESQISRVPPVVEEKTGMDFDRFTRSVLLAQGGFDSFLKAPVQDKSKILEQITGTNIYTEISRSVHERQKEESQKLELLNAEISGIEILEDSKEEELKQVLKRKQQEAGDLERESKDVLDAIAWLNSIEYIEKEIEKFSKENEQLKLEFEEFQPFRQKLKLANKASLLDGDYAKLVTTKQQFSAYQTKLKKQQDALPYLKEVNCRNSASLKLATEQTKNAKDELTANYPLLKQVRSLDQSLNEKQRRISNDEEYLSVQKADIQADKAKQEWSQTLHSKCLKKIEKLDQYFKENKQDEWLLSGLEGIKVQLNNLISKQREISQIESNFKDFKVELEAKQKELIDCNKQRNECQLVLNDAEQELAKNANSLQRILGDRLLREYRTELEYQQQKLVLVTKIASLQEHRVKLEDGEPCPLCGSTDHPYAEGNVPLKNEVELKIVELNSLITDAENQEEKINLLSHSKTEAESQLLKSQNQVKIAENNIENAKAALEKENAILLKSRDDWSRLEKSVSRKLEPLVGTILLDQDTELILESLEKREGAWRSKSKQKQKAEQQRNEIESQIKSINAIITTKSTALKAKEVSLNILRDEHTATFAERKELFGTKDPDDEELRLNLAIENAERAENSVRTSYSESNQNLEKANAHINNYEEQINQITPILKAAEFDFTEKLNSAGFADEPIFLEARLTEEQRNELIATEDDLKNRQTALNTNLQDRTERLKTELAKNVTERTLVDLKVLSEENAKSVKQVRDTIANHKFRLHENSVAKEKLDKKRKSIQAQQKEYVKWRNLHELIGSADGKKYRNFAQGLTFKLMVSHANRQLAKMTDRYLLIPDEGKNLILNVVDNYQAGEIRPTSNLSGGETFIVSLTLALGLSKMASRKVRVDSLFLDEGFGTLDEEALDSALDTLSGLQHDGKLIGIISHVAALKERISTQIKIEASTGGRSVIRGPGCS